jgi:hypothetical protein
MARTLRKGGIAVLEGSEVLHSQQFAQAVSRIQRRAERQIDPQKLEDIFVQTDMAIRARTSDSQLVLGRRGTGKTHLMRAFERSVRLQGEVVYYFDCTRLGSGYSGLDIKPEQIAPKYFVALLNELGSQLLDAATNMEMPPPGVQERALASIIDGLGGCLRPSAGNDTTSSTFNYRQIADSIDRTLDDLDVQRLFLILDEWAQIPVAVQPHLSEYLKRTILALPRISLKLLAVSYQCQFLQVVEGGRIGIERGADITDVLDLDLYLIYDEKSDFVTEFFAQVLYNHVGAELGWVLQASPEAKMRRVLGLFTQRPAFVELVRAAEGNCRDFLCMFSRAYFEGFRQAGGAAAVSIPHVRNAASTWFDTEKHANIRGEDSTARTLEYIVNEVVSGYKSRTFMVESSNASHHDLTRLLNERLLHRIPGYYSHPDRPGIRYEIFTIDYGAYVRFKGTVNEPHEMVIAPTKDISTLPDDERAHMVPLDDKRSIRRIIFDPDKLVSEV